MKPLPRTSMDQFPSPLVPPPTPTSAKAVLVPLSKWPLSTPSHKWVTLQWVRLAGFQQYWDKLNNYSETSLQGTLWIKDTPLLRALSSVPTTQSCVRIYLLIRDTSLYRTASWFPMVSTSYYGYSSWYSAHLFMRLHWYSWPYIHWE